MKTALFLNKGESFTPFKTNSDLQATEAQLVLCFGSRHLLASEATYPMVRSQFPNADIVTCSTAGEIFGPSVYDDTLSVAAVKFDHTHIHIASVQLSDYDNSFDAAKGLMKSFGGEKLNYLLVLSDGTSVNGSELSKAFAEEDVLVTGGLAGDGDKFETTLVGVNGAATGGTIVGIYKINTIISCQFLIQKEKYPPILNQLFPKMCYQSHFETIRHSFL